MDFLTSSLPSPLQELSDEVILRAGVRLLVKRDDLIHPAVSGNKWRKLKYNLIDAQQKGYKSLLTFGGAYSNHLYAVAAAGKAAGIETIGVVRGHELTAQSSSTLRFCQEQNMRLFFVSRDEYRLKEDSLLIRNLIQEKESTYIVPEGGSNPLALPGVREMVVEVEQQLGYLPDYFTLAAGTGGTAAGILSAAVPAVVFPALKGGEFIREEIGSLMEKETPNGLLELITDYHFGGYARYTTALLDFIRQFESRHQIPLEQVYTGKMFFGVYDLLDKGFFKPGSTLVAVHTGGLQGRLDSLSG